jgi:hypothetical protein
VRLVTGRARPVAPLAGRRRPVHIGMGLFIIAAGAILLFAVPAGSSFGINLHVVGIILMVVGALQLLLPAVRGGPKPERLRRMVNPSGVDNPEIHDVQSAAAADDAWLAEDDKYFEPRQQDEL